MVLTVLPTYFKSFRASLKTSSRCPMLNPFIPEMLWMEIYCQSDSPITNMECGYDVPVVSEVESRFQCPICLLVLREPVQTACGHRFCDGCIKRVIVTNNVLTCPVDKQYSRVNQMFPDVAIQREILSLTVKCSNVVDGCGWQGELRDLEKHRDRCRMEPVSCPHGCDLTAKRWELDSHVQECPSRQVQCEHCGELVVHNILEDHLKTCPKAMITCPLCGTAQMVRDELPEHTDPETGTCGSAIVCCPFSFVGCRFKAERFRVNQHALKVEALQDHLTMAGAKLSKHEKVIEELRTMLNKCDTKLNELSPVVLQTQKRQTQISRDLVERNMTGKLHWKVKVGTNSRGRSNYISPVVYTGCPGYKVRLNLEVSGHSESGTRYSSLYMELLQGDYDEQMIFPFNATCFVTLYDQVNPVSRRVNITNTLVVREVPRLSRSSQSGDRIYRRGINKFIRRTDLVGHGSRFLRHGSLHLEVTIVHCFYPPPDLSSSPRHMVTGPQSPIDASRFSAEQALAAAAAAAASPILSIASLSLN